MADHITCKESVRLYESWVAVTHSFLTQGAGWADMRKNPDYQSAYQAYWHHQQECSICSADRHRLAEFPVYPMPAEVV